MVVVVEDLVGYFDQFFGYSYLGEVLYGSFLFG